MSLAFTLKAGTTIYIDPFGKTSATLNADTAVAFAGVQSNQELAELMYRQPANFALNATNLQYTVGDNTFAFGAGGAPRDLGSSSVSSSVSSSASSSVSSSVSSSTSSSVSSSVSSSASRSPSSSASASSDSRLKSNILPLEDALSKLAGIRGVGFVWNQDAEMVGKTPGALDIGVIAQDVEQVFPELVSADEAGHKQVNYNGLVGVLFAAVAELHAKVNELERPRALAAGA